MKTRIVSGMRPTGQLHVGHLLGALDNWLALQAKADHECYFFVADYHALTSQLDKTQDLAGHTHTMLIDWLSSGLDPQTCTLFVQSQIPEQPQLFLLLSMLTPMGWLERNPTYKELLAHASDQELSNLGFFSYPVMQTADIALYKGQRVPVGHDQLPHLEMSREIVRRFNHLFKPILPEPQAMLTPASRIMGTDGRKMSKSYGNALLLSDTENELKTKLRGMLTDPQRARRQDPGNPKNCNLYPLHEAFSSKQLQDEIQEACTSASIGCVDCKAKLLPGILDRLGSIQAKRETLLKDPDFVADVFSQGQEKASRVAKQTLAEVREAMSLPSV